MDDELWLVMASVIAVFDVRRARDADGIEIAPEIAFVAGLVRCALRAGRGVCADSGV